MTTDNFEKSSVFGKGVRPSKVHQLNDQLRRDIYAEIRLLNKTLHTGLRDSRYSVTVEKFIDALIPSKSDPDYGRLPIYVKTSRAPKPDKVLCVFHLVSSLIQCYWGYLDGEDPEILKAVQTALEVLRDVNRHYNIMKLDGDIRRGWVLKI